MEGFDSPPFLIMKVKLNKRAYYKGKHYNEGDTPTVNARVGGAWIQSGKANEILSKKTVRTSNGEQAGVAGGENTSVGKDSGRDDE